MIIAYPGHKKSPLHKFFMGSIKKLKENCACTRNRQNHDMIDVFWGNGTTEAMKRSLTSKKTDRCALIHANEFHTNLSDFDRITTSKDDESFFATFLIVMVSLKLKNVKDACL